MKKAVSCALFVVYCVSSICAQDKVENLGRYFDGFSGCFVLYDESKKETVVYNESKSAKRISPCSSFKVVHALIGLETGVLKDENSSFQWDGARYPVREWNRDQTPASAVTFSVVWCFQQVARKVGKEREQYYVDKIGYGNRDLSGSLTGFWLQSSLKISPKEQVEMLKRFYHYRLPFSKRNVDIVKKILVLSRNNGTVFSGKSGSGANGDKAVNGWFIGYIEKAGAVYFFALNIEGENRATGSMAKEIAQRILRDKNLL
ncbi:MAG: class D beta-lactamase [Spirochaetales bacterium]|nr:class D beta-lactamase [Spirochaetales bacterium]